VLIVPESPAQRDGLGFSFTCAWVDVGVDVGWLHLAGELDLAATPELERTLRESRFGRRLVVLDLRELEFMDSAGVHVIIAASRRAREAGGRLVLVRGAPNVDRMFSLTGSLDDVEIVEPGWLLARGEVEPL
jgi:anti-sigma B factor antagonist